MVGFETAASGSRTVVTPDTCNLQDTNSADFNSARHEQLQENNRNADYWIEYFPSGKKFRRKKIMI